MKRLLLACLVLGLLATACGSSSTDLLDDAGVTDPPDESDESDESNGSDADPDGDPDDDPDDGAVDDYGDDADLDALWDGCEAGDMADCDQLYFMSPIDSGYETFGSTCGETGAESFGECDGPGPLGDADTYGDDPDLDALWDGCEAGDLADCDQLYLVSPIDSDYETFGSTCGGLTDPSYGECDGPGPLGDADTYGDDPDLDALWDSCEGGDLADCDELYLVSPIDSDYESFGSTCGGLGAETYGDCAAGSGGGFFAYGDDPTFDRLWDECEEGNGPSCDELYWTSPVDSEYEAFGASCGDRFDETTAGTCEEGIGIIDLEGGNYGDDPVLDALWDDCAAGDGAACDTLYFDSPFDSEYEDFGNTCGDRFPDGVFSCETEIGAG